MKAYQVPDPQGLKYLTITSASNPRPSCDLSGRDIKSFSTFFVISSITVVAVFILPHRVFNGLKAIDANQRIVSVSGIGPVRVFAKTDDRQRARSEKRIGTEGDPLAQPVKGSRCRSPNRNSPTVCDSANSYRPMPVGGTTLRCPGTEACCSEFEHRPTGSRDRYRKPVLPFV